MSNPALAVMAFWRKERRDRLGETAEVVGVENAKAAAEEADVSWRGSMVEEAVSSASKRGGRGG